MTKYHLWTIPLSEVNRKQHGSLYYIGTNIPKLSILFEKSVTLYQNKQYFLSNHQQRKAGVKVIELYQIFRKVFHQKTMSSNTYEHFNDFYSI